MLAAAFPLVLAFFAASPPRPIPAAAPTAPDRAPTPAFSCKAGIVSSANFDLRKTLLADSPPIASHGAMTVWIADKSSVAALRKSAVEMFDFPVFQIAYGQEGKVSTSGRKPLANPAAAGAQGDRVAESADLMVRGKPLDQGVLVHLAYQENHIVTIHKTSHVDKMDKSSAAAPHSGAAPMEVAESARAEIAGEWLIPPEKALVVSLGMHTVWEGGSPRLIERSLIVAAMESQTIAPPREESTVWLFPIMSSQGVSAGLAPAAPPSRTLPGADPHPERSVFEPAPIAASSLPSPQMIASLPPLPPTASAPLAATAVRDDSVARASLVDQAERSGQPVAPAKTECCDSDCTEPARSDSKRELTLPDAIRLGLQNSAYARVIEVPQAKGAWRNILVEPARSGTDGHRFRSEMMAHLRSIEQMYWALRFADVQVWVAEAQRDAAKDALSQLESRIPLNPDPRPLVDCRRAAELFAHSAVEARSERIVVQRQLANLLAYPPGTATELTAVTPHSIGAEALDWNAELALMQTNQPDLQHSRWLAHSAQTKSSLMPSKTDENARKTRLDASGDAAPSPKPAAAAHGEAPAACMPPENPDRAAEFLKQIERQVTHSLARFHLELEANTKRLDFAYRARSEATLRLKEAQALFVTRKIDAPAYFEALRAWGSAVEMVERVMMDRQVSIVALHEAEGTLLDYDRVIVLDPPSDERGERVDAGADLPPHRENSADDDSR